MNSCNNSISDLISNTSSNESKTNLIVNYLPQTMVSDEFKSLFQSIGSLESCKLIRDKNTNQNLGYGFVNYIHVEDAEKAIKHLNGIKIENKVIKVSYARPCCDSIKGANLYICNIPKNWSLEHMNAYFSCCGKIITSRILVNSSNGHSKGVGFIRFDQRAEADLAIQKLNGSIPENFAEPITVKFANYPMLNSKMTKTIPYVKSNTPNNIAMSYSYTDAPFLSSSQYNPRIYPISTHKEAVIQALTNHFYSIKQSHSNNCIIDGSSFGPNTYRQPSGWCIFVYNLSPETEENILWQLFGPFGAVQNVKIIRNFSNQLCKGFGFVTMTVYDEAVNAINALNGMNLFNRVLQVSFKSN